MRYSDRILFLTNARSEYNPETGEYDEMQGEQLVLPCYVMDLGIEKSKLLFGDYEKDRKVVYFQNPYIEVANYCEYMEKQYKVIKDRQSKTVLYLEGDKSI